MTYAELRWLHSPDVEDLEQFMPADPEVFGILVQAMVGPHGAAGSESFDFIVCTPGWLATENFELGYRFGRHHLFLKRYDYSVLWQAIEKLCNTTSGSDWTTAAERLGRYGHWEFEDYRGYVEVAEIEE
jgi:hypothetical protein